MKNSRIFLLIFSLILSFSFIEIALRIFGLNKHVIYYSSNYYGYYHVPNQNFKSRFNKLITFDNLGNRNSKKFNIENTNLFFLGDSVTYGGSVVSNDETFSSLISKKMEKNYLNISSNGWGIPNIINFIDSHNIYKKNSVYVMTCINDCFTRNLRKIEQNFFFKKKDKLAIVTFYKLLIYNIYDSNTNESTDSYNNNKKLTKKDNLDTLKYSFNKLILFNEKLKKLNSKLIFVYSPNLNYLKSLLTGSEIAEEYIRMAIFDNLMKSDISYIDMAKHFDQKTLNNFGKFYIDHVHLSREGHKLYSEILSKKIYD